MRLWLPCQVCFSLSQASCCCSTRAHLWQLKQVTHQDERVVVQVIIAVFVEKIHRLINHICLIIKKPYSQFTWWPALSDVNGWWEQLLQFKEARTRKLFHFDDQFQEKFFPAEKESDVPRPAHPEALSWLWKDAAGWQSLQSHVMLK